jgi:hypothetical protein
VSAIKASGHKWKSGNCPELGLNPSAAFVVTWPVDDVFLEPDDSVSNLGSIL